MASKTLLTSSNVDDISWATGDTLTINNGATISVTTNQTKYWTTISVIQGTLLIQNTSSTQGIRFSMGGLSGSNADSLLTISSQLGNLTITGSWIYLGTGSGVQQTVTSPFPQGVSGGFYDYIPAVFVESSSGSGIYTPWFNCTFAYGQAIKVGRESTASLIPEPKKANWFRQPAYNEVDITLTSSISCHFYPDMIFGETGNVVPVGCNIRIPNILLTRDTPTNNGTDAGTLRNTQKLDSGNVTIDKAIFGQWRYVSCTPVSLHVSNAIYLYPPSVVSCYDYSLTNCAIHSGNVARYFNSATLLWSTLDFRQSIFTISSCPNSTIRNVWSMARTTVSNAYNVNIDNFTHYGTFRNAHGTGLQLSNLNDSTNIKNIKIYSNSFGIGISNNLIIDGVEFSYGQANEITATSNAVSWLTSVTPRIGYVPARRERFQNNIPYYFKIRTYKNWYDLSDYTDNPITYSATPYQGRMDLEDNSDMHPYYFGAILNMVTSSWVASLRWTNPSLVLNGSQAVSKYQIFKSTSSILLSGSQYTGSQFGADLTVNVLQITDTQISTGSTYYYTLRCYRNSTEFTDSAQQTVIVPNFIPTTGSAYCVPLNRLLQSCTLLTSPWTNSGSLFAPTVSNTAIRSPIDAPTQGITTSRGSSITFAATGDGGRIQTVTVSSGSTYTISAYMLSPAISGSSVLLSAITNTTSSVLCDLSSQWKRFSVTHIAGSTSLIFSIVSNTSTRGKLVYVSLCQVESGSLNPPIITTTTQTAEVGFVELKTTSGVSGGPSIGALSRGGRSLIELGWTSPASTAWFEIFCETSSNFTPSLENCAFSNQYDSYANPIYLNDTNNNVEIKNVESYGPNPVAFVSNSNIFTGIVYSSDANVSPTNLMIRNVNINGGFVLSYILSTPLGAWSGITLHNINVTDSRGFNSRLSVTPLIATNLNMQNVIVDYPEITDADSSTTSTNMNLKGCSMLWSGLNYTSSNFGGANTNIFGSGDGITLPNNQFDRIFGEAFCSGSNGIQYLLFTPTVQAVPAYVISGSNMIFDNTGKLYMGAADETITYTWPWRIYGITGFQNKSASVLQSSLGSSNNNGVGFGLLKEYTLSDDGITYNNFKEMSPENMFSESIDADNGFFMKIRLTPKQFFKYSTKSTDFIVGETITNSASLTDFTGSAVVTRVDDYPGTTTGSIWISNISGNWDYLTDIYSNGTLRARMNGDSVFGPIYPQIVNSYVQGIAWPTFIDRTKKYPASYSNITVNGLVTQSFVSVYNYNTISSSWLESNSNLSGSSVTVQTPWDGNFTAKIKFRKAGYRFGSLIQSVTRFGTTIDAEPTPLEYTPGINPTASIVFTDCGTSSFVYGGKNFRYKIQIFDTSSISQTNTSSAQNVASWFFYNTATDDILTGSSYRGTAITEFILEDGDGTWETQKSVIDTVSGSFGGLIVLNSASNPLYGFSRQQSNDGTYFTYPALLTINNINIISGSRIRLFNSSSQVELDNRILTENGYNYQVFDGTTITAGNTLELRATYTSGTSSYYPLYMSGICGDNGLKWIDMQIPDTIYAENAIDGSTVTEFSADYPSVQIDLNDPDGVTTVQRLYNWMEYIQTTSGGIASFFNSITAIDSVNYRIESDVINLQLENISSIPVRVIGAYLFRSDGSTVIASSSYSIQMDPNKAYVASAASLADGVWLHASGKKVVNNTTLIPALL